MSQLSYLNRILSSNTLVYYKLTLYTLFYIFNFKLNLSTEINLYIQVYIYAYMYIYHVLIHRSILLTENICDSLKRFISAVFLETFLLPVGDGQTRLPLIFYFENKAFLQTLSNA